MVGNSVPSERVLSDAPGCGPLIASDRLSRRSLKMQVFERVRASGTISRVQVARELDISPASVTTLTSDLIEQGLLHETEAPLASGDTGRGRPPVALAVQGGARLVVGIKLSDRVQTAVVLDLAGEKLAEERLELPGLSHPVADVLEAAGDLLTRLLARAGLESGQIAAVGIGLPGFVDHATGHVFWSPILTERHVDFAAQAQERLGLPVVIDNDANLVALAELWFGAGRDRAEFVVVTIEHGVGMGLVSGHRLYRGARGLGMELGHVKMQLDGALCRCGQRGCLEAYVADYAMAREADTALGGDGCERPPLSVQIDRLYDHAKAGHPQAWAIFHRAARYLAGGLANVITLFDPELIIISGGRMRYDYLYAEEALSQIDRWAPETGRVPPQITVHARGDLLWAYGAAALALAAVTEELFQPEAAA